MPKETNPNELNGSIPAAVIKQKLKAAISSKLFANFRAPTLAVLLLNDDHGSLTYVRLKILACGEAGIKCVVFAPILILQQLQAAVYKSSPAEHCLFSIFDDCRYEGILALIERLNDDTTIDATLMQV